jgi:beta-glucosidase-like glycosyl hydrolase
LAVLWRRCYNVLQSCSLDERTSASRNFATGKHFPWHGDTETDSHKALPTVIFSGKIRSNGVLPYKQMFKDGFSVMVAHLNVPA